MYRHLEKRAPESEQSNAAKAILIMGNQEASISYFYSHGRFGYVKSVKGGERKNDFCI